MQEMGSLWVDEEDPTKLVVNPNAWTNVSSMLFLEAPACVGYSYTDDIIGCSHNDSSQALDNYAALRVFFTSFPEYVANKLFITGESYDGMCVVLRPEPLKPPCGDLPPHTLPLMHCTT